MRATLVVLLAGCLQQGTPPPGDPGGWIFPGGRSGSHCQSDAACSGGDICARNGACMSPSLVHPAHVTWTLSGMPASQTTCNAAVDLEIDFASESGADDLGYAPVPCIEGKFTVDKLPTSDTRVRLGRVGGDHGWQSTTIDPTTGDAMLDLMY